MDGRGETGAAVAAEKARLRERFQTARMALSKTARARASRRIVERLLGLDETRALSRACVEVEAPECRTVGLFWPRVERAEVDVLALRPALSRLGLRVAFPRVDGPGRMTWHTWTSETEMETGRWGLVEPSPREPVVAPTDLSLVVVPGVAFGRDGSRLGWGGGYYDRALAETGALAVGVTFSAALADALPTEPHDRRMDLVITESDGIRTDA